MFEMPGPTAGLHNTKNRSFSTWDVRNNRPFLYAVFFNVFFLVYIVYLKFNTSTFPTGEGTILTGILIPGIQFGNVHWKHEVKASRDASTTADSGSLSSINQEIPRHGVTKVMASWIVGNFIKPESDLRNTRDVEIKWSRNHKGKQNNDISYNKKASTIAILISGRHHYIFGKAEVTLTQPGDYIVWGPNVPHTWIALEESTVITIRFPSLGSEDQVPITNSTILRDLGFNLDANLVMLL